MSTHISTPESASPHRPRFRFNLKTLLVLMSLVAVWLTIYTIQNRRADELIARRVSILHSLAERMNLPPDDTIIRAIPAGQITTSPVPGRGAVLHLGGWNESQSAIVQLQLGSDLQKRSATDIERRLIDHYVGNLVGLGLEKLDQADAAKVGMARSAESWRDPRRQDFTVTVSADYDGSKPLVDVLIFAVAHQTLFPGEQLTALASWLAAFVLGLLILRTIARSMLGLGRPNASDDR